jgi:hypothetical protein
MLDWKTLTFRQKSACLLLGLFLLAVLSIQLAESLNGANPPTLRDVLGTVFFVCTMLAVMLNPEFARGSLSAFRWKKTPTICKALLSTAFLTIIARGVVGFISSQT